MSERKDKDSSKTVVLEARTDIRLLASLQDYFVSVGAHPRTRSELVNLGLELAHLYIQKIGKARSYELLTFNEAYGILQGYGNLHKSNQNKRKLHELMAEENYIQEQISKKIGPSSTKTGTQAVNSNKDKLVDPRINIAALTFSAMLENRTLSKSDWDRLNAEDKQLVRESQPELIPDEIEV